MSGIGDNKERRDEELKRILQETKKLNERSRKARKMKEKIVDGKVITFTLFVNNYQTLEYVKAASVPRVKSILKQYLGTPTIKNLMLCTWYWRKEV